MEAPGEKYRLDLDGEIVEFHTADFLLIDRHNLDGEMAHQAAWYAWFATRFEKARAIKARLEMELDEEMASFVAIDVAPKAGKKTKAPTVTATKAAARITPKVRDLFRRIAAVEYSEGVLKSMRDAFAQRKDMIRGFTMTRDHEMSTPTSAEIDRARGHLRP